MSNDIGIPDFDKLSPAGRIRAFDALHEPSPDEPGIRDGGYILFADGAKRDVHPLGPLIPVPSDPMAAARLRIRYAEIIVRRAVDKFETLREQYIRTGNAAKAQGYHPPLSAEDAADQLNALKTDVRAAQTKLDARRRELDDLMPGNPNRARGELQAACHDFLATVTGIQV